ncbi:MAG: DUF711 family protein [Pseudomonadota bacterium]
MTYLSRRDFLNSLAVLTAVTGLEAAQASALQNAPHACRIRTLTAGVTVTDFRDLQDIASALSTLARGRTRLQDAGYTVQTIRIATSAAISALDARGREAALPALRAFDQLLRSHSALGSIGPCAGAAYDPEFAAWITELIRTTTQLNCSIQIASPSTGVHTTATRMAAETMLALSRGTPDGLGNFRFSAAAHVPAGTPFFPVAYHLGPKSLAIGMESAALVGQAIAGAPDGQTATARLRELLNRTLLPVQALAEAYAQAEGYAYLGIDASPAPALDRSIGASLEALLGQPFGSSGSVDACASVTAALRSLDVKTCGYSGLMLPVVEDPILALRASEGRFGLHDLLLFSSVCGTGLDLTPIPGDTPFEVVERVVRDTAALSHRWAKPLSARLLLVPGKKVGELAHFSDPLLTDCRVMAVG